MLELRKPNPDIVCMRWTCNTWRVKKATFPAKGWTENDIAEKTVGMFGQTCQLILAEGMEKTIWEEEYKVWFEILSKVVMKTQWESQNKE